MEYQWEAHYKDGTILKQYDPEYHSFSEINQSNLKSFWIVSTDPPIILDWKEDRELLLFTDNVIEYTDRTTKETSVYCVGYKEKNRQTIIAILPDKSILLTDNIPSIIV